MRWTRSNPGKSLYDARRANKARTVKPSGLQVSFYRARKALMAETGLDELAATRALKTALSDRQRDILEQREHAA